MSRQVKKAPFKRGFKKWADDMALKFRSELCLKPFEPLDAFLLGKHLEVPIYTPGQIEGLSTIDLNTLSSDSSRWSAATIPISGFKNIVIHNPEHSSVRQQSNIMHELAHIICGHKVDPSNIPPQLQGLMRHHNELQENEADWLGACLQLPRPALLWALKQGMSPTSICDYFNASSDMVRFRVNVTGVNRQLKRYD